MILYEETLEDIKDFENFKNKLSDSLKSLYDDIDFFNNTKIPTKWEDRNIEKYKIIINPVNVGDIKEGIVKYKKSDLDYWTAAKDNEIIVNQLVDYDIIYIDANNNSKQKKINLSLDSNKKVVAKEVTQ